MTNPYSTHLPLLLACVRATTGPVLELGMGEGSTPALHDVCKEQGRHLVSYDTDLKYINHYSEKFAQAGSHDIIGIGREHWDKADIDRPWSVVLVDHKPAARRRHEVMRLKDLAEFIVIHDTEPDIDRFYRFSRIWKHFGGMALHYGRIFHDGQIPRTSVIANTKLETILDMQRLYKKSLNIRDVALPDCCGNCRHFDTEGYPEDESTICQKFKVSVGYENLCDSYERERELSGTD